MALTILLRIYIYAVCVYIGKKLVFALIIILNYIIMKEKSTSTEFDESPIV